jgi:hypothetical protein
MKMKFAQLTVIALAVVLSSCSIGLDPDTTGPEADITRLDADLNVTANSAVATADALLTGSSIGASTTYNFDAATDPIPVDAGAIATLPTRANFPYPGWTTSGTVEHIADAAAFGTTNGWTQPVASGYKLFKVTAVATPDTAGVYPETEVREVYYVQSFDAAFDSGDSIFDPFGWSGSGYRDEYIADYADGSTRSHWVTDSGLKLAPFDINGSLDFETVVWAGLANDADAVYSSVTVYTHELGQTFNYWFWNNNDAVTPLILGWRYYTEHLVGGEYVGTSLTIEYTFNRDANRDPADPVLLARTVIREEMRFVHDDLNNDGEFDGGEAGAATDHTLRLQTEINNTSDGAHLVYTRNGKSITDFRSNGNARNAQLAGVQRNTLPAGYGDFAADFSVTLAEFE